MIAHPPLNSMRNNSKLNNIRKKNFTKKKTSSNEPKKKLSEIEKLELENHEMEQRLLELKQNLAKEKEKRLKQGKSSFWQSGKKGVLFNHGNEVIYNKNLNQMKNKDSIYGISLKTSSSNGLKNKDMFDPMRYLNLNSNRKNTLNLLTTSVSTQKSDRTTNKNSTTTTTKNNVNNKNNISNQDGYIQERKNIRNESVEENGDIVFQKKTGGLLNFNKYIDSTTEQLNSINLSTHDEKTIIKSKFDEAMKKKSLIEDTSNNKISSGINTSYSDDDNNNNELYHNNYFSSNHNEINYEQNGNTRLIDGEFNEEESHNSFVEALNMWRKERREQEKEHEKVNSQNKKESRFIFSENNSRLNVSETQTKELDYSLNMDEIIKNMQNSKTSLSYMEKLALYKYREQYKKYIEESRKPKAVIKKQNCEVTIIDEDEIDAEVEKYWEENNNDSDDDNYEKEIEDNINSYVNQYKMKQLEIIDYNLDNNKSRINNTKTSIFIEEDSLSEEDENAIIEYNEISPIVDEPEN